MLDRIVRNQPPRPAHRLPEALENLRVDRPEDVKLVPEKIIDLLDRVTRQVEIIQKAPVLQYDIDDLAHAFERGGRQALKEAICGIEESQRQIEANLAEIQSSFPGPATRTSSVG